MSIDEPAATPRQFGNLEANLRFLDRTGVLTATADILEIGSGTGALLRELCARGLHARCVELQQEFVDAARRWKPDLPIERVGGVELPFPGASFDVVMSFDVFEHIRDSDAHLREVRRVLRFGGSYVLQTPNKWTNVLFETIRWRSFTRFREDHCSLHTIRELTRRLERHGFGVLAFDVPVVNDFFRGKVRQHLGWPGLAVLRIVNPDRLPIAWRTNLYVRAVKE